MSSAADAANCPVVAYTGTPVAGLLFLAAMCLAVGLLLVFAAHTHRARVALGAVLLVLLAGGLASAVIPGSSAWAASNGCAPAGGTGTGTGTGNGAGARLTVTQSSVDAGLAPNVAPIAITGLVINHGSEGTFVTAVTVRIVSVTRAAGASDGRCDASDYLLLHARMPVARNVAAGTSVPFAGAFIGFNNKSTNQDACQRATVSLAYLTS